MGDFDELQGHDPAAEEGLAADVKKEEKQEVKQDDKPKDQGKKS